MGCSEGHAGCLHYHFYSNLDILLERMHCGRESADRSGEPSDTTGAFWNSPSLLSYEGFEQEHEAENCDSTSRHSPESGASQYSCRL